MSLLLMESQGGSERCSRVPADDALRGLEHGLMEGHAKQPRPELGLCRPLECVGQHNLPQRADRAKQEQLFEYIVGCDEPLRHQLGT